MLSLRDDPSIKAILFDLSGVIFIGRQVIPGAAETIKQLRQQPYQLRFVTNTASESKHQLLEKLQSMGIDIQLHELFTAVSAASQYIQQHKLNPFCIVHEKVADEFVFAEPFDSVLISDAREGLNYANLNRAFQLCLSGKRLLGVGDNLYFQSEHGLQLDAGPFIRLIAETTGQSALILGKPSFDFFHQAVSSTGYLPDQCLMIGDDVISDVEAALNAGLKACLVKTGKYRQGDEERIEPNCQTIDNIQSLLQVI